MLLVSFEEAFIKVIVNLATYIYRGRQSSFMSLSALLCANSCDILTWTSDIIDRILIEGDAMYLKAFEERSIPDEETLSLSTFQGY